MKVRNEAYQYYFFFIQERMNIFWKRYEGASRHLTSDPILAKHKFTNVYRAQDRVSQFLIRNVIYDSPSNFNEIDVLLRILVFKVFNNIETWIYLENRFGPICIANFKIGAISKVLDERIKTKPIFSAAYMMAGSHEKYSMYSSKHERWLHMIEKEIIKNKKFEKIAGAKSLGEVYEILLGCSFIGEFLAYQYAIDFNYSEAINFSEDSFVKAGIGAIRGIKKCFPNVEKKDFEACIRYTQENFSAYQKKYGFTEFRNLFGREPKLIDLQNCFCETDKYLRVKMPELQVDNFRIKQKFTSPKKTIDFFFPPKWDINKYIKPCNTKNSQEITLF
jgi:hypothetical protein